MRPALYFSFLLGAALLPAQDREFGTAVDTTLSKVRTDADAFQNVKIRFTVQFASLGRISNPFFTKFTPTDFANFYAWCDEQPIWRENSYNDVFGMLFLAKTHPKLEQLYGLQLYQRLRVTGVTRNTFQNLPWIEVTDFEVLDGRMETAVLTHMHRGEKLMEHRLWRRAIAELSLANGPGLPPAAQRTTQKNMGICLMRMGEVDAAIGYLESAQRMSRDTDFEVERLLAVARKAPAEALDRTVDATGLRDSERPMWEAFDADRNRTANNGRTAR